MIWENLYLARTKNTGLGIFARHVIRTDERVFVVRGKKVSEKYDRRIHVGPNWMATEKCEWIDPFNGNAWTFINHSCNPNVGIKGKLTVVAMRKIEKDEEVTIDYSITEDDPYWKMRCACGSEICRGVIGSVRSLSPILFRKYEPYVPLFLRKSYLTREAQATTRVY